MFCGRSIRSWAAVAAIALIGPQLSFAQEPPDDPRPPSRDELVNLIGAALPDIIGDDNSALVETLMNPGLGAPIRESFDLAEAVRTLFGRALPTFASDCKRVTTPAGEPDPGNCTGARGDASGPGAYTQLSFSKHLGLGNLKYSQRSADTGLSPDDLVRVQMSDAEAYGQATAFLTETFGVPPEEIPQRPKGVPPPVRDLVMAWADEQGAAGAVAIQKVVTIQRGLKVDIAELPWVRATGDAMVVMDDQEIQQAAVRNWVDLIPHPDVDPANAKSRSELTDEIVEDLLNVNKIPIDSMRSQIVLAGITNGVFSIKMLPSLLLSVAPVARDPEEAEQHMAWSTAGFLREYSLVNLVDRGEDEAAGGSPESPVSRETFRRRRR